jgi:hypothetical protein
MDKLFGEIDYVAAREAETGTELKEATAYSSARPTSARLEKSAIEHVDADVTDKEMEAEAGKERK